jgi:LacI family transcriptional regulator
LGLLLPGFSSPVYSSIAHGVEVRAGQHGYGLVIGTHAAGDPHETITDMLMHGRVDALLVSSGRIEDRALRRLVDQVPQSVVLVNRQVRGVAASVVLRDADASAVAVTHLAELGHREICGIFGPTSLDTMVRRRRGFFAEATLRGVRASAVDMAERDQRAGFDGAQRALDRDPRPTAVVAGTFPMAVGALAGLHAAGIAVPGGCRSSPCTTTGWPTTWSRGSRRLRCRPSGWARRPWSWRSRWSTAAIRVGSWCPTGPTSCCASRPRR